jgi:hypothetical protein
MWQHSRGEKEQNGGSACEITPTEDVASARKTRQEHLHTNKRDFKGQKHDLRDCISQGLFELLHLPYSH